MGVWVPSPRLVHVPVCPRGKPHPHPTRVQPYGLWVRGVVGVALGWPWALEYGAPCVFDVCPFPITV